jgi:hypothetical protein
MPDYPTSTRPLRWRCPRRELAVVRPPSICPPKDTDQHTGYDDDAGIDERRGRAESDEVCLGARIVLRDGSRGEPGRRVRPYFGGGASLVRGRYDSVSLQNGYLQGSTSKNGSGYGYWAQAGIMFRPREHFSLGFDLRHSKADVDMGGRHRWTSAALSSFMGGARRPAHAEIDDRAAGILPTSPRTRDGHETLVHSRSRRRIQDRDETRLVIRRGAREVVKPMHR